MLINYSINY